MSKKDKEKTSVEEEVVAEDVVRDAQSVVGDSEVECSGGNDSTGRVDGDDAPEAPAEENVGDMEGVPSADQADGDDSEAAQPADDQADDAESADADGLQEQAEEGAIALLEDCLKALRFYASWPNWKTSSPSCVIDSGRKARELLEKYNIEY